MVEEPMCSSAKHRKLCCAILKVDKAKNKLKISDKELSEIADKLGDERV